MKHITLLLLSLIVMTGCTTFRSMRMGSPSVDTYLNFALDTISGYDTIPTVLISSPDRNPYFECSKFTGRRFNSETIGEYFARVRGNGALLIVRNDTILLEEYYGNFSQLSPSNIFSVSKSLTSLLCGIAVDEGYLHVDDPVTKYIPELATCDPLFSRLTVEHLLDMRTGLDFKEDYGWNPLSDMAKLYYGDNVVTRFKKLHFKETPGKSYYYNSMATALLGVVVERAVSRPFAAYMQEKVWKQLDMEADAFVSLDDPKHRQAKAYGGIVTNVRDLAKIGRLYINGGMYGKKRIVSNEWIVRSTHSTLDNQAYSYGWNNIIAMVDDKEQVTPRFFAIGLYGQILFCDPDQNLIFVTLGEKKDCEYHLLFDDLCTLLQSE